MTALPIELHLAGKTPVGLRPRQPSVWRNESVRALCLVVANFPLFARLAVQWRWFSCGRVSGNNRGGWPMRAVSSARTSAGRTVRMQYLHRQHRAIARGLKVKAWRCWMIVLDGRCPLPLRHFSDRRHETLKAQGESVSIREVLGAIWQMYGAAMQPLQSFEHRTIVLCQQAARNMKSIVGIDADEMCVERGVMNFGQRDAVGHDWLFNRSSLSATMCAASRSRGSGNRDNAQRPL
jgi:hypothetical protein